MSVAPELVYFNGVNASRGEYGWAPVTLGELVTLALGGEGGRARPESIEADKGQLAYLKQRVNSTRTAALGVVEGIDPANLAQAGWAVIFPGGANYAPVRDALSALLDLRKGQAGDLYRECFGPTGYQQGEGARDFLRRQGAATSGPADPKRFPYYVLLVGSPEEIPFRFQYQLDVQYAVGRLHLPSLAAYASYASSVVAAERGEVSLPRRVAFFAPTNPDDPATAASAGGVVASLAAGLAAEQRAEGWEFATVQGADATKARLSALLGGAETPALLFTAGHGAEFDPQDLRLPLHQGAIICQDWPGPRAWARRALPPDFYLSGDDIGDDARLLGTVVFQYGSFGAGMPRLDDFPTLRLGQQTIAPYSFVSGLAQRLLGHPKGGALAVLGPATRLLGSSLTIPSTSDRRAETFAAALRRGLLAGAPLGWAMEYVNDRYAELSTMLTEEIENIRFGKTPDDAELAWMWTEYNDSRSLMLLGDPAVRLPVARAGEAGPTARATIQEIHGATAASLLGGDPSAGAEPSPDEATPRSADLPPPANPQPLPPAYLPQVWAAVSNMQAAQTGEASFGIGEWLRGDAEAASEQAQKIRDLEARLLEVVSATVAQALQLDVTTYVGDGLGEEGRLVANSSIAPDGDVRNVVASEHAAATALLELHARTFEAAEAGRQARVTALATLLSALRGLR